MTINQLIKKLKKLETLTNNKNVSVASDEEWNTIYKNIELQIDDKTNRIVIYGLDGKYL